MFLFLLFNVSSIYLIGACKKLKEKNPTLSVGLLEARDRVGGRVWTGIKLIIILIINN